MGFDCISPKIIACLRTLSIRYGSCAVNPLYNGIRYNMKIRYNVNLICTKNQGFVFFFLFFFVFFFIDSPMLFFRKTYVFDICKNRFAVAILTNLQYV